MTKISKIINAGQRIENTKTGFTIPELMSTLNWDENEKQYVQNTMFNLTRKGKAYKLGNTRPVVYSFKQKSAEAPAVITKSSSPPASRPLQLQQVPEAPSGQPGPHPERAVRRDSVLSMEDLADMDIPLELIGEGVFRRNRELERRIYELESELVETKRKLDDAHKRISEQTRMLEKQNQIISGQNMERKPTAKMRNVASVTWKRRS